VYLPLEGEGENDPVTVGHGGGISGGVSPLVWAKGTERELAGRQGKMNFPDHPEFGRLKRRTLWSTQGFGGANKSSHPGRWDAVAKPRPGSGGPMGKEGIKSKPGYGRTNKEPFGNDHVVQIGKTTRGCADPGGKKNQSWRSVHGGSSVSLQADNKEKGKKIRVERGRPPF